jgi:CheY-like chemotaxis protein
VVARYDPASLLRGDSDPVEKNRPNCGGVILVADDSESDRFFLMRAFAASGIKNPVRSFDSGYELTRYLKGDGNYSNRETYPLPAIVFVDLQMPPPNGIEVLKWKQTQKDLPRILWVAMSNFNSVRTINDAYSAGATTFLTKPLDGADVTNLVQAFEEFWSLTRVSREHGA